MLTETNQNTGHPLTLDNGATVLGYTEFGPYMGFFSYVDLENAYKEEMQ